ncbi:hypothetical protein JB92DRAFT_3260219 [Gautieria morchelliformis]|nr:hypothetical protein JB92DRAFT_3260219 [Gautieria morchelliformis]
MWPCDSTSPFMFTYKRLTQAHGMPVALGPGSVHTCGGWDVPWKLTAEESCGRRRTYRILNSLAFGQLTGRILLSCASFPTVTALSDRLPVVALLSKFWIQYDASSICVTHCAFNIPVEKRVDMSYDASGHDERGPIAVSPGLTQTTLDSNGQPDVKAEAGGAAPAVLCRRVFRHRRPRFPCMAVFSGLLVNFDVLSAVSVLALRLRRHGHTANSTIFVLAASVPVAYAALSIVGATSTYGHKQTVSSRAWTALLTAKLAICPLFITSGRSSL